MPEHFRVACADYQSICVTWLPRISFPFSFICLAAAVYSAETENWSHDEQPGNIPGENRPPLLFDCKGSFGGTGRGWGWSDLFLMSSEECLEKCRESMHDHLHLVNKAYTKFIGLFSPLSLWRAPLVCAFELRTKDRGKLYSPLLDSSFRTIDRVLSLQDFSSWELITLDKM